MSSKVWGYARISTAEQKVDRQVDLLMREHGIPKSDIFIDTISGAKFDRPALAQLQKVLREGDTVVVESLSRVSRSSADLLVLLNNWQDRGITFISHKERLDFSSTTGKFMLSMLAALSQFERDTLRDRVSEGIAAARARGRIAGKPRTDKKSLDKAIKLHDAGMHSIKEICEIAKVSKSVLYRELKLRSGGDCDRGDGKKMGR
ncbi:recombinase family protein [Ammoniphilus sp. CFH 90114]|uniref:recombinase family protein n=1 Tax=Ammoniphilus sp. CFH 90114 TaxID=2493665 RepID=UPI00100F742F|nr:recombinase family protein [Ammoniphilus sp. CFH 90114]RXT08831.1 recombinase family protein [Ammoniphilus sp. CFH 90114]